MLPPQLRASRSALNASSSSTHVSLALVRAGVASSQHRSFRTGKSSHWTSQLDPLYLRLNRYHTLKRHYQLKDTLKRRAKLEWDETCRPMMSDKHHRWASHYNGKPVSPKWLKQNAEEQGRKKADEDAAKPESEKAQENDDVVLTPREKRWKQMMVMMKKRIDQDPYEAVFGKRFEPFWSPLVPTWMREEMGLHGRSKSAAKPSSSPANGSQQSSKPDLENDPSKAKRQQQPAVELQDSKKGIERSNSYSSYSTTSYDSWTNKARRTEWDSISGQAKHFEYDPISNRMVQIESAKKTEKERTAIAVPTYPRHVTIEPVKSVAEAFEKPKTSVETRGRRPAALSNMPENDLDLLTADNVRASMGKTQGTTAKASSPEEKAAMEADFISKSQSRDAETDAVLKQRDGNKVDIGRKMTYWDKVQSNKPREPYYQGLEHDHNSLTDIQKSLDKDLGRFESTQKDGSQSKAFTSPFDEDPDDSAAHESTEPIVPPKTPLQPSVDRMQSKPLPARFDEDFDDSAAHESTEPINMTPAMPKDWANQADLLQSARVDRISRKMPFQIPESTTSNESTIGMSEGSFARKVNTLATEKDAQAQLAQKLKRANEMLEAEVEEQKFRLHSHETRYAHKIRSLRQDLDVAYKESSRTSQEHIDRIRNLESELEKAQKAAEDSPTTKQPLKTSTTEHTRGEGDFCTNVVKFADSSKWYKRHANPPKLTEWEIRKAEQKLRDQSLVQEVRGIYEKQYGKIDLNHRQAANATIPAQVSRQSTKPFNVVEVETDVDLGEALAKHEKDQEAYGFKRDDIGKSNETSITELDQSLSKHESKPETKAPTTQVAKVDSQIKLENALAQHEQGKPLYTYKDDGLAEDIALQEKRAQEAILAADKERAAAAQSSIKPSNVSASVSVEASVKWEEPSVYKVLAYDSGNDQFSTATTTSNFTPSEQPISIPQALSQLYQPARFVPYFAELQKDGYQAIYGTRDLLVFKKVQTVMVKDTAEHVNLVDHGLLTPKNRDIGARMWTNEYYDPTSIENGSLKPPENEMAQEAANAYDANRHAINPVDGTARSVATGNFASPTGFVNYDPILPLNETSDAKSDKKRARSASGGDEFVYSRVRREEPVFSGASAARRYQLRAERSARREERRRRRRSGAGAIRWALTVGLGTAALTYTIGVAAEAAREDKKKERWEKILEGRE